MGGKPVLPLGGRGGDAAIPDRNQHFGEGEIVRQRLGLGLAVALGVGDGLIEAFAGPVGTAEGAANAPRLDLGIHGIDELADRHVEIVAVHEIDVDIVGLQAIERLGELLADDIGVAERGVSALADDARPARGCRDCAASRRTASRYSRRHRRRRCRRYCRRASQKASSRMAPEEKVRKSSKPRATAEADLARPGMERLGMTPVLGPSLRLSSVWTRLAGVSTEKSMPASVRHLSSTRALPRLSAQLMPGAANSWRLAKMASAAASTSNE